MSKTQISPSTKTAATKAYKIPKVVKYPLPIPCLVWVPFWLLGIVFARFLPLSISITIPLLSAGMIIFFIRKSRLFSIPLLSMMAGYFIFSFFQALPSNHISNLFEDHDIPQTSTYISVDETWIATSFQKDLARRPHIQQLTRGKIVSDRQKTATGYRYSLELLSFDDFPIKGNITLFTKNDRLVYGDIIETTLRIRENRASNPGETDFSVFLQQSNIYASAYEVAPISVLENSVTLSQSEIGTTFYKYVYKLKRMMHEKISNSLVYSAPMALSLVLGERQHLSEYAEDFYTETLPLSGLMHFFAVSGFHVGIIALFLLFIFKLFRLPRNPSQILTILTLILYAFLCGSAPPVVRAVTFFSLFILAEMTNRLVNKWQVYLFSLFLVTLIKPSWLFSASLQLSYLAFAGIIIGNQIYHRVSKAFSVSKLKPVKRKVVTYILNYIFVIGCIQVLIMPAQIYYFNYFTLNAFIGNLLGVIFVGMLLPLFLIIILLPYKLNLYGIFTISAEFLTDMFNRFIDFMSKLPFVFQITQNYIELICLFVLLSFGFLLIAYNSNKKMLFQGLFLCVFSFTLLIPLRDTKGFQIIFFDTRNSDCFLLRFSEKDYMIIDTGSMERNSKNITQNLLPYLKQERIRSISKVLLTHEHNDHYGGIFKLGEQVKIDTLIISEKFFNSSIGNEIRQSESFKNTVFFVIDDTLTYRHRDYTIKFLHPDKGFQHRNENNNSLVCKINYKDIELLFVGDIEIESERHLINRFPEYLKADILKAGHHGSNTSSHEEFLSYVRPEMIVFSATGEQSRNLPHPLVLERSEKVTNQIFTTGRGGAVMVNLR